MVKFGLYIGNPTEEESSQTITITLKEWNEKNTLINKLKSQNDLLLKEKNTLWEVVKELTKHIDNKEVQGLIKP